MKKRLTIYIDGRYLKVDAKIAEVITPGVFQGDGVFETMLAIGHKVFDVKEHLRRLHASFKGAKVSAQIIQRVVEDNGFDVARVRVLAWREGRQNHVAVMALPYRFPTKKIFQVCLIKTNRPASSRFANKKSLDYKLFADAYTQACSKGFDEVLLVNQKGYVFEASRGNVFIFTGGQLITSPLSSGCLNGITRRQLIRAAQRMGIPVLQKNLTPAMIQLAQEVFLTNSLIGIRPVKLSLTFLPR